MQYQNYLNKHYFVKGIRRFSHTNSFNYESQYIGICKIVYVYDNPNTTWECKIQTPGRTYESMFEDLIELNTIGKLLYE